MTDVLSINIFDNIPGLIYSCFFFNYSVILYTNLHLDLNLNCLCFCKKIDNNSKKVKFFIFTWKYQFNLVESFRLKNVEWVNENNKLK